LGFKHQFLVHCRSRALGEVLGCNDCAGFLQKSRCSLPALKKIQGCHGIQTAKWLEFRVWGLATSNKGIPESSRTFKSYNPNSKPLATEKS
jgi:hypothetical protein